MVEGIVGPVDVARLSLDERDVRPRRLKVEEPFRLDLCEALSLPDFRKVAAREGGALSAVVPTAERRDQNGRAQVRP